MVLLLRLNISLDYQSSYLSGKVVQKVLKPELTGLTISDNHWEVPGNQWGSKENCRFTQPGKVLEPFLNMLISQDQPFRQFYKTYADQSPDKRPKRSTWCQFLTRCSLSGNLKDKTTAMMHQKPHWTLETSLVVSSSCSGAQITQYDGDLYCHVSLVLNDGWMVVQNRIE